MKLTKRETKEMMRILVDVKTTPIHDGLRFAISEAIFDRLLLKSKPKHERFITIKGSDVLSWVKKITS